MDTVMKKTVKTMLCLFALLLLPACETLRVSTLDNARDTFADARNTWKAGTSTYEEMIRKYGQPSNKVDIEGGFAARWLEKRSVTKSEPVYGNTNPAANFEAELNRPMHVMTITTALEAFYDKYGVLTNFRIQVIE